MEVDPDHVTTRVRRQRREQFYSRHPTRRPAALLEGDTPIIEVKIVIPTSTALSHQEVLLRRQNAGVSVVPVSSSTEGQLRRRVVARTLERTRIYTRTLARTREATCLVRVRYGVVGGGGAGPSTFTTNASTTANNTGDVVAGDTAGTTIALTGTSCRVFIAATYLAVG